jgi:dihydroorotate dehydrogenase electron transfer subunit
VRSPRRIDAAVVSNRPVAGEGAAGAARCLRLRVGAQWAGAEPGQFVMLSPGALGAAPRFDPLLPRPMAVYRAHGAGADAEIEILYKVAGRGTALLADAAAGQRVRVVGPLGRPFRAPAAGERAVLVGGGTGIASLLDLAARAARRGAVTVLLGARCAGDLMGQDDFAALGVDLRIATEDGSTGQRGLVTELLPGALEAAGPVRVYACGPTAMMRRAAEITRERAVPCVVSLENRMACGFGICLGCAVPRAEGGFALVCRDGPVFAAEALAWPALP